MDEKAPPFVVDDEVNSVQITEDMEAHIKEVAEKAMEVKKKEVVHEVIEQHYQSLLDIEKDLENKANILRDEKDKITTLLQFFNIQTKLTPHKVLLTVKTGLESPELQLFLGQIEGISPH